MFGARDMVPARCEENKCLNTLLFCKFSHLEVMEGPEIVIVGACPL